MSWSKSSVRLSIVSIMALFVTTLLLSACSSQMSGTTSNTGETTISWGVPKPTLEGDEQVYEQVVDEYMKLNPDVNINIAFTEHTDSAQWNTWLTSQLVGGVAPDVVHTWHVPAMENYRKNLVVDLQTYLDQPNPYDSKDRSWWDSYSTGLVSQNKDTITGAVPSVPLSTVAVKVFYNKDIFEKAGITETPSTFSELLAVSGKIQASGVAPFIAPNKSPADNVLNWVHRMFMDQMIEPMIPELDLNSSGLIELNEIAAGTDKGIINLEISPWSDSVPLLKQFSEYWYPGYNGIDNATAMDLFIKQEGAMIMQTGNVLKNFLENPDRKFEVGFFSFPYLTKEDSPHAVGELYEMGGAPQNNYSIPSSTKGAKLEAAVDFLRFLASEKGASVFAEGFWWTSPIQDAVLPAAMEGMYIEGSTSSLRLLAPQTNQRLYQDDTMIGQLYLEGKISAEEFNATLQKNLKDSIDQLKKQNDWNEKNGWGEKASK